MEIIDRIEELLEEKGISGAKMSRDLGFSNAVYSQWRSGKQRPSLEKIKKMADYFEVSTDYLSCKTNSRNEQKNTSLNTEESVSSEERKKAPLAWGYDNASPSWERIYTNKDNENKSESSLQNQITNSDVDMELLKLIQQLPDSEKYKLIGRIQAMIEYLK